MCGRFALTEQPEMLKPFLGVVEIGPYAARYNIAPTQPIMMVGRVRRAPGSNLPARTAHLVRWGFIPAWAKDTRSLSLLINARSETAAVKPTFRAAMRHRRTLVPASGFYEWRKMPSGRAQPFFMRPIAGTPIAFAGIAESWLEPGGSEIDTGAILTTEASADIADIHHRMPVVLSAENFERWLDCDQYEPRDMMDLLQKPDPGIFEAIPISDLVNKVSNMGPEIQQRISAQTSREEEPSKKHAPQIGSDKSQLSLF